MNHYNHNAMNPITEDDIANYLSNTPDFFERHAQLLAQVQLTSPHGNRAVSLQERQAEMLREKIKALEHRVMDMVRHGTENVVTADRLQRWTRGLLTHARSARAAGADRRRARRRCSWCRRPRSRSGTCDGALPGRAYAQWVSDDVKALATSLTAPYCGLNSGFEAANWLAEPHAAVSIALIPLRPEPRRRRPSACWCWHRPIAQRFNPDMGTDFLERIAELASGALSRLRS